MNWSRVRCLFSRELRDQLRDRRTMFTIFCLPLMLYPLMGLLMLQMAQLRTPRQLSVVVVANTALPPAFLDYLSKSSQPATTSTPSNLDHTSSDNQQSLTRSDLASQSHSFLDARGNKITWSYATSEELTKAVAKHASAEPAPLSSDPTATASATNNLANDNATDDASHNLSADSNQPFQDDPLVARATLLAFQADALIIAEGTESKPKLQVITDLAAEGSQLAYGHVTQVVQTWRDKQLADALIKSGVDQELMSTLPMTTLDVAESGKKQTLLWAKVLPLIMFVWALTGAFYPAIDLCAGEKERGTLETLLSGPASRKEIVSGKLLAVICFSVLTAVLNLLSMQITIAVVAQQFSGVMVGDTVSMGPLPWHAIGWLLVMLLPISILFSAVALAIAALARSSKEGQYYLMPLLIVGMPLVMLPMLPGIRLSIGTSLFPVAGAILLARTLVEGHYAQAILFAPMVVLVTGTSCWLATRWAIRQFESESVLFRETDRFDMTAWLHHLWRDRHQVATPSMAALCAAIILISLFYVRLQTSTEALTWSYIAKSTIATQLAMILAPCLIMAIFLTTSIRKALRVERVNVISIPAAILLAVAMHPTYIHVSQWVQQEFPFSEETKNALAGVDSILASAPLLGLLLTFAVIPAICEELAFRGFIFAGMQTNRGAVRAIVVTSLLFGLSHGVLQQSISATLMGFVLGLIAWRTGSVICCILIHICHNSLSMLFVRAATVWENPPPVLQPFIAQAGDGLHYTANWQAISSVMAISLLYYFLRDSDPISRPATTASLMPSAFARESLSAKSPG